MTWDELHTLQRKLAEWLEPWAAEGHELYHTVDDDGRSRREHLAWFQNQRAAALAAEMHNGMLFLINSLVMHERAALDRARARASDAKIEAEISKNEKDLPNDPQES